MENINFQRAINNSKPNKDSCNSLILPKKGISNKDVNKKIKMRKNAFNEVDKQSEKLKDPKYKSEMCKKYEEKGFCDYGNSCRFAHGKDDLLQNEKDKEDIKYKVKNCMSFHTLGYCPYGIKCNFKHSNIKSLPNKNNKQNNQEETQSYSDLLDNYTTEAQKKINYTRLSSFNEICDDKEMLDLREKNSSSNFSSNKDLNLNIENCYNEGINYSNKECHITKFGIKNVKSDSILKIKEYFPKNFQIEAVKSFYNLDINSECSKRNVDKCDYKINMNILNMQRMNNANNLNQFNFVDLNKQRLDDYFGISNILKVN